MSKKHIDKKSRFSCGDYARVTNNWRRFRKGEIVTILDPTKKYDNYEIKVTNNRITGTIPSKYLKKINQ